MQRAPGNIWGQTRSCLAGLSAQHTGALVAGCFLRLLRTRNWGSTATDMYGAHSTYHKACIVCANRTCTFVHILF